MLLRENYTGNELNRGRVNHSSGQAVLENSNPRIIAPTAYLGEALETQTALMERSIMVELTKAMKRGASNALEHCQQNREILASFGWLCAQMAMKVQLTELDKTLYGYVHKVGNALGPDADDQARPVFNAAVNLAGLGFAKQVLQTVFGKHFDGIMTGFETAVLDAGADVVVNKIMSEAAKVLHSIAHLSTITDEEGDRHQLRRGVDYIVDDKHLQLNMRNVYTKYVRYQRSLGQEALYDNFEAFLSGMRNFSPTMDRVSIDSVLKVTASTAVYTFNLAKLTQEGVGDFKT